VTIGIMSALAQEADLIAHRLKREQEHVHSGRTYFTGELAGRRLVLVYSRVGKVAAAATTQHLIDVHRVGQIIFTGVAGALDPRLRVGDVVVAERLWQHDLDASPIFPPLEIPLLGVRSIPADAELSHRLVSAAQACVREDFAPVRPDAHAGAPIQPPRVVRGDIASGDRFVSSADQRADVRRRVPSAACVEMEGAAVAQVCLEQGIPFGVVRVISDSADGQAATDFSEFIREKASRYGLGIVERFLAASPR
jgi:adenosylhomocysteine nucleosidase